MEAKDLEGKYMEHSDPEHIFLTCSWIDSVVLDILKYEVKEASKNHLEKLQMLRNSLENILKIIK